VGFVEEEELSLSMVMIFLKTVYGGLDLAKKVTVEKF
jgi:hypothetical protein